MKLQNLINGPVQNPLGITGSKVIVPGDTNKSILFRRIGIVGQNQMPPLARNIVDTKPSPSSAMDFFAAHHNCIAAEKLD